MSTLNLPQPVHNYAGQDELRNQPNGTHVNGNGTNGDVDDSDMGEYVPPKASDKLKAGMIYPPREIRGIIDKTANHISKSPTPLLLEEKIKEFQKTDPKFSFLTSEDPYHQYYRYMIEVVREGSDTPAAARATPVPAAEPKEVVNSYEPKPFEFKVDLPGVTAMDLDILRLTALFHARRGRSFLSSLSVREGRNYQFDFLRPTHSLYGYYNRMVESYIKIINPPPGLIENLVKEASDPQAKWKTLDESRNRAEWERSRRKREGEEAREKEEESKAFAAIDWQDFVTVETIEFTQQDVELDLPPPTSSEKLKSMSMAEKRMASMVMEETGAGPAGGDLGLPPGGAAQEEMEMEDEEEEEARLQRIKAEQEQARAREVQKAAMAQRGVKIRSDYVPKGLQRGSTAAMQKCPYCGQMIAESELTEHIRIELLDPKWKEQKKQLELRRTQAQQLQQGADVSASLRNLANARTDLFGDDLDEEARRKRDEEEKAKRKEREKIIWDGHLASAQKTSDTFQSQFNLEDQIKKMHSRIGLADQAQPSQPTAGPQAGPGIAPQPLPPALAASLPTFDGKAYAGATISAAPTGPSQREYTSVSYDSSFDPSSSAPSAGPSVHPSRLAQMDSGPSVAGQVHPREEEPPREKPVFKRPKIEKLPYGQLYSEIDWMSLHPDPITIAVQLPSMPEKPEWKLDGSVIAVPGLPVNTTFATLRDRIKRVVDADLPISRLRLDYNGKVMTNNASMASVNLDDDDMLVMSVRKK